MEKLVVEVGMKLNKSLRFYRKLLEKHNLKLIYKCTTHDIYFTQEESFDGLTENQIKNRCVRIRNPKKEDEKKIQSLFNEGYKKVFDTIKKDYQYKHDSMKSMIQLQQIKNVGLVVYYDNPDYYQFSLDKQRKLLFEELNSYGFNFNENDLGIDKLRTLYYRKELFSKNQNG
ncbi:MAG: hypothetical protein IKJ33_00385 [Clostridia bacterium]|nr:hypothetical protein [Clostridia bacterium]